MKCIQTLLVLSIMLIGLIYQTAEAQNTRFAHVEPTAIDEIFEEFDETTGGCAVGVVDRGELIFSKGYGMANLDYGIPLAPDSRLMIASISKQFTAAALLMMEQEGILDLDEDLRVYIPELPEFDEPITARMLITHTSGLRDLFDLLHLKDLGLDHTTPTEDAFQLITGQSNLNFEPNTDYLYSNSGYVLMAVLVENLTGSTLREYTDQHLFEPIGMTNTHFHDDLEMVVPNRADSYTPTASGPGRFYRDNIDRIGARGLFTTIEDFAKWDANFIENRSHVENFTERMTQVGIFKNGRDHDYAMGLRVGEYRTLKTIGHGGNYMGFRSDYVRFPDQGISFIVFCNMGNISPAPFSRELADLYLKEDFSEIFDEYRGVYRNESFGSEYRLFVEDGNLYLQKGLGEKEKLDWQDEDEFRKDGWDIEFIREKDEIRGFTVQNDRTGKLKFKKITASEV